jgi:hypothetical protein|tara:strand:- start:184 stop:357 length:174 start_codon:yes stop_codon:yes gene_type:complete
LLILKRPESNVTLALGKCDVTNQSVIFVDYPITIGVSEGYNAILPVPATDEAINRAT